MNIDAVALSATTTLTPYFRVTPSVDEPFAEDAPDIIKELWRDIVAKFRSEPRAEVVIRALIAQPNSLDNQDLFRRKLREILGSDPTLLSQLAVSMADEDATAGEQAFTARMNEVDSDDGGAYPRPLRCRRRCEG